jgi:hypothetical protein
MFLLPLAASVIAIRLRAGPRHPMMAAGNFLRPKFVREAELKTKVVCGVYMSLSWHGGARDR